MVDAEGKSISSSIDVRMDNSTSLRCWRRVAWWRASCRFRAVRGDGGGEEREGPGVREGAPIEVGFLRMDLVALGFEVVRWLLGMT